MTITPTTALPGLPIAAPGEDASGSGPSGGGASADFLAAILDALSATTDPTTNPPADPPAADGTSTDLIALATGLVSAPVVPVLVAAAETDVAASPGIDADVAIASGAAGEPAGQATATGETAVPVASPAPSVRVPAGSTPVDEASVPVPAGVAPPGPDRVPTGVPPAPGAPPGSSPSATTHQISTAPTGRGNVAEETGAPTADPAGDVRLPGDAPAAPAPTSPRSPEPSAIPDQVAAAARIDAGAPTTATTADGADRVRSAGVPAQVFPEVTRLVSRGDGVHRVAMTLNPESLGEVRVVMTMRAGVVRVHLSASDGDVRAALAHGSPELARLLETAGAGDTRIVVRDLSQGPASSTAGHQQQLAAGDDRHHAQEHAGTRAQQHLATDGTNDTTPLTGAGADLPRSIEPVADTRTPGVDVTV